VGGKIFYRRVIHCETSGVLVHNLLWHDNAGSTKGTAQDNFALDSAFPLIEDTRDNFDQRVMNHPNGDRWSGSGNHCCAGFADNLVLGIRASRNTNCADNHSLIDQWNPAARGYDSIEREEVVEMH
jgi:hypothetical protein